LQAELRKLEREKGQNRPSKVLDSNERYLKRGKLTLDLRARQVRIGARVVSLQANCIQLPGCACPSHPQTLLITKRLRPRPRFIKRNPENQKS